MKLKPFQQYLKEQNIDLAFFAYPDVVITYFTQMRPSFAHLVITPQKAFFYITELDKKPSLKNVQSRVINGKWYTSFNRVKTIGINYASLTIASFKLLKKRFPKSKFVDVSPTLKKLRMEKTSRELLSIAKACRITTDAFNALLKELPRRTLKTEKDVMYFLEKEIQQRNGGIAFPTIVAMGKHAATPHHVTSDQPLHKGFLLLDFGASYHNYCADMSRTIYLGKPSANEKKIYHLLLNSQQRAVAAISLHQPLLDLEKAAREVLEKYQKTFKHSLGHGIGLEVHELPNFTKGSNVEVNVPFTIEPGIYLESKLGIRIEDTLYFDGKKTVVLTKASRELICIG